QGLVHLRIVVDAKGLLKDASIKKSSGFARIDQQALQDIRTARFAPYTEGGQAIEWETTALLSYELDR
ncbi:MAG TPA: energy transducer TonB, partial [Roseateles sp.]|nr:energy transducer TonB [Roseateles sp.]